MPLLQTLTRRPVAAIIAALFTAVFVVQPAPPARAAAFPPQLPSQEEMNRLQAELESSLKKVRAGQAQLDKIVRDYEAAERRLHAEEERLEAMKGPIAAAQGRQVELESQLGAAQSQINGRAASSYRAEVLGMVNVILEARTFRQFLTRLGLLKSVISSDSKALDNVRNLKSEAIRVRIDLEAKRDAQAAQVASVDAQRRDISQRQKNLEGTLAVLGKQYESVRSEIEKRKSGFAFPVRAPYSYVDTYGAPRMEGTAYYHRHEGIDIFAASGTPLFAVVDGVLEKVGTAKLGGTKLWLRSPGDNWMYYYAHLSAYGPGVREGLHVKKGQVIGYIGNTGNAITTPPHVHFETHMPAPPPDYGPPTNAYPILRRVDPLKK
ncbi:MAG: murein hydrolase activator EnvC family protein [Actinomycetota bacterium]